MSVVAPRVRRAVAGDAPSIGAVHANAWREGYRGLMPDAALERRDPEARATQWRRNLESDARTVLIAVDGERVIGFASLEPSRDPGAPASDVELTALYVEPSCWRQGAGRVLVAAVDALARENGSARVTAWVLSSNEPARAFYDAQGFRHDGLDKVSGEPPLHQTRYSVALDGTTRAVSDAPVRLVPFDPTWAAEFARERDALASVIAPWLVGSMEHFGSTAIAGLAAKPVIDIMAPVRDLDASRPAIDAVAPLGYCYAPYRPDEIHWFCKPSPAFRTHHLHLVPLGSELWNDRLAFRNYLRSNATVATQFAVLKKQLATEFEFDREAYTEGKRAFVAWVLDRARSRSVCASLSSSTNF